MRRRFSDYRRVYPYDNGFFIRFYIIITCLAIFGYVFRKNKFISILAGILAIFYNLYTTLELIYAIVSNLFHLLMIVMKELVILILVHEWIQ